jgi:hypothetical protein
MGSVVEDRRRGVNRTEGVGLGLQDGAAALVDLVADRTAPAGGARRGSCGRQQLRGRLES